MAATALGRLLHLAYDHWHLLENALARDASCEKTRRRLDDWRATGGFLPAGRTIRIRGRCLPHMGPGPFDRVYAEAVAEAGVSGMGGHLLPKLESFRAAYSALLGGVADIFERGDWQTGQLLHDSGFLGAFNDLKDVLPAIQAAMPTPNGPPQVHRLAVHIETLTAELDGTNYDLSKSPQAARWLAVLASHPGQWLGPRRLAECDPELYGARTDRLKNRLPEQLRTLIESQPGQGSRLMA